MNTWDQDPFFQYPISAAATSEGKVDLPILYYDNSNLIAMFWVDYQAAQTMLGPQGLTAIRFAGGKALVALAFYEYRHTRLRLSLCCRCSTSSIATVPVSTLSTCR